MCGGLSLGAAACLQYGCFTYGTGLRLEKAAYYAQGIVLGVLPAPCFHPEAPGQT